MTSPNLSDAIDPANVPSATPAHSVRLAPPSFGKLVENLIAELRARDQAYLEHFAVNVPLDKPFGDLPFNLGRLEYSRFEDLFHSGLGMLRESGIPLIDGPPDAVGEVIIKSIADFALAELGLLDLSAPDEDERSIETVLAEDFDEIRTEAGTRFWRRRTGSRPLLIVNALGIPLQIWRRFLGDRTSDYRFLIAETRCGDIFQGGMASPAGLSVHSDDLVDMLEHIGDGVDVIAWCNGGRIAIDLAHRRPDLVRTLTLLSPTLRCDTMKGDSAFENQLSETFENVRKQPAIAGAISRVLTKARPFDWSRSTSEKTVLAERFLGMADTEHADFLTRPMATGDWLKNYAARTALDEAYPMEKVVAELQMPVLVLTGKQDDIVDNSQTQALMAKARDVRFVEIAGAGHYAQHLQFPFVAAALWQFLTTSCDAPFRSVRATRLYRSSGSAVPTWMPSDCTATGERGPVPLDRIFAWAADVKPFELALDDGRQRITFAELESQSGALACRLVEMGAGKGASVLVLADKCVQIPVVAGAIWKAGGIYVPVDPANPPERLADIAGQIRPAAIVGSAASLSGLSADLRDIPSIAIDTIHELPQRIDRLEQAAADADDTAYVIFTSGSTGSPKGVEISHGSLLAYFEAHNRVSRISPRSRAISFSPFYFDVSIEDTILPLSLAAPVYQFRGMALGPKIRRVLHDWQVTHLVAVSSILALITGDGNEVNDDRFPHLEMIMTGAEICDPRVIDHWVESFPRARVINAYGPTEATIVCLTFTIDQDETGRKSSYPIGTPLAGVSTLLVDDLGEIIDETDVAGELLVGGIQVMKGYRGLPDFSAACCPTIDGIRYYRTRDRCYRDRHGRYVYVSRMDDMVKIGGRRIHLNEISQQACNLADLQHAVAGVLETGNGSQIGLVAIRRPSATICPATLRQELGKRLPAYMVPAVISVADAGRLTPNGKMDDRAFLAELRKALLDPSQDHPFLHLDTGRRTKGGKDSDRH